MAATSPRDRGGRAAQDTQPLQAPGDKTLDGEKADQNGPAVNRAKDRGVSSRATRCGGASSCPSPGPRPRSPALEEEPGEILVGAHVPRALHAGSPAAERPYDLVTVGELISPKRLADLIAIVERLRSGRRGLRAAIAGIGSLREELVGEAERPRPWVTRLTFSGSGPTLSRCTALGACSCSRAETRGLSVAMTEALASGPPVVVSDVGELGLADDGRNGRLVPVGDSAAFVEAIEPPLGSSGTSKPPPRGKPPSSVRPCRG